MAKIYRYILAVLVLFAILELVYLPDLKAQPAPFSNVALEPELTRAESYLYSRTDSAVVLTDRILTLLKTHGQVDTPFGIRVQFTHAAAFEISAKDELALPKLLRVEQLSRKKGLWEIHARTCLWLAALYEAAALKERSRQQLNLAKADIKRYGLQGVYPRFAVRMASWQRLYNDKDSALFFAREALRIAPRYGSIPDEADGYFLVAALLPKSSYEERLQHLTAAATLYRKMGNKEAHLSMINNIARSHFDAKNFPKALTYYDSAMVGGNQLIADGKKDRGISVSLNAYKFRGDIYQRMGRLDSALTNTKRGYELELKARDLEERDKINEIDARYQTKLKQKQIDDQQLAIQLKNNQLLFAFIIVLLVMVSAVGLLLAYRKQRQAKQKLLEQNALIQLQATQLKTLDAAKSRFFANVSHELRTPLTLLIGPIGTLLNENRLTERQASLLQLAQRSGKQLEQLVADILDLGKLEMGKMELNEKPTPLAAFFRSHFTQFESLAESRHLHYSVDISVPDDAVANLDQAKYRQILSNLLANAFKFTPSGGQITAALTLTDGRLHLCVADTGPGIHPDDLPHLFDRYFQTTRPDKPAEGGTGIGLALCQEYVQLFGGKIDVESTLGTGSVFRVMFPVAVLPTDARSSPRETSELLPTAGGSNASGSRRALTTGETGGAQRSAKPTLLVVDDNPDLRAYIGLILADHYQVVTAENGQAALNQLRTAGKDGGVSLILSDLMMPFMDGHQLLERLKADDATRHIPVIMLTARADAQNKLRALRIGVDDYLLKPFDEEELLARIDNLLANQATRQQAVANEQPTAPPRPVMSQADREWLETFEHNMQQHLADSMLTVPDLAHHFAMSESTLLRQLKRLTGLSPLQYVQAVRLEEARRLLESRSGHSIGQVAAQVGYEDARSFGRSFRARFGKLPSEVLEN